MIAVTKEYCDRLLVTIKEKDAEIERLEAALDAIIAFKVYYGEGNAEELQAIARAAWSNKKESK